MKWNYRIFLAIALFLLFTPSALAWYDINYNNKTDFNLTGSGNGMLSLNISNATGTNNATWKFCNGNCNANFSDLAFTYNDNTLIPFEIENATGVNATTAKVWIKIASGTQSYPHQMYYNYPGATSVSNPNATWIIIDDFTNGTTLNTTIWTEGGSGTATVADGNLTMTDPNYIRSKSTYSSGYMMRVRARFGADDDDHIQAGFMGSVGTDDKTKMSVPLRTDVEDYDDFMCVGGKDSVGYKRNLYSVEYDSNWHIGEFRRGGTADYCALDDNHSDSFTPKYYNTNSRYLAAEAWTSDIIVDWIKMGYYSASLGWGTYGQDVAGHVTYIPPAPILSTTYTGANASGNLYVNHTWEPGIGNVTDQYNICVNSVCVNASRTYDNYTFSTPHEWKNITVMAINTSNNTMNTTNISDNYDNPNNYPTLDPIGNKKIYQDRTLTFQMIADDLDNDTITYGTNATKGTLNTTSGVYTWTPAVADVGVYTWYFNISDGYPPLDGVNVSETINVTVKANRLINISLYNTGWQVVLVNDTMNFSALEALFDPTYMAVWNATSQDFEKYHAGWLYRTDQDVSNDQAVMMKVATNKTVQLNITHSYNYTLKTGHNLISFPENITMSAINTSVNVNGTCGNVEEITYIYPENMTEATYSCVSGTGQPTANVTVLDGRGAWLYAMQNVTILDALG